MIREHFGMWLKDLEGITQFHMTLSLRKKQQQHKEIAELESQLQNLTRDNQRCFLNNTLSKIMVVWTELNSLFRSRQNYYFQGSRPSHILALRLRNSEKFANISGWAYYDRPKRH